MINIHECTISDINILAEMNKQLIEDENDNNLLSMDIIGLKNRMTEFLNNGYRAYLFFVNNVIVGYALCDMTKEPKYLRQFFIKREVRRKHYGKTAFEILLKKIGIKEIEIDVLIWNETGIKFWESIGFKEQWKRLKYKRVIGNNIS
jgi:predicted acetyltransferase